MTGDEEGELVPLRLYAEETSRRHEMEKCLRISAEVKLQRACAENDDLRDHIKFLEYRLSRNNENNNNNNSNDNSKSKSEDEAFNGRSGGGSSLVRSRSLSSLDTAVINGSQNNNCNIQEEFNAASLRDDHNNDDNKHIINIKKKGCIRLCDSCKVAVPKDEPQKVSAAKSSTIVELLQQQQQQQQQSLTSFSNQESGDRPKEFTSSLSTVSGKPASSTVDNYRDMFAEIFQKLQVSKPMGEGAM